MIVVLSVIIALMLIRDIRSQMSTNRNTRVINSVFKTLVERIQKLERTR